MYNSDVPSVCETCVQGQSMEVYLISLIQEIICPSWSAVGGVQEVRPSHSYDMSAVRQNLFDYERG